MLGKPVIFEKHDRCHGSFFYPTKILHQRRSQFQDIMVFETEDHGRVLFIDGQMMFTSTTQGPYNESMAFIPLHLHANPRRVLVIGGGDGVVLKNVLKFPGVEAVVLAELDGDVIEVTRDYFPDIAAAFDDPRVEIMVGDGARYVREARAEFDVVIIDSTDPYLDEDEKSVATPLATVEFYDGLAKMIGSKGIAIQILGHYYFYPKVFRMLAHRLLDKWNHLEIAQVPVPFYISGTWSLALYANFEFDARNPKRCQVPDTEYYNADIHRAAFAYPSDLKRLLSELKKSCEDLNN